MPRAARVVVPGVPHHVTQRGNRRQPTFFCEDDYRFYFEQLSRWCRHYGVEVWAWAFMANHSHLIAVPPSEEALSRAIGLAHQFYTEHVNRREGWSGHLWQGRFFSAPMDEAYLRHAVRYVEMNPVEAGIVADPFEYRWSSARAHLAGVDDGLVRVRPMLDRISDWKVYLAEKPAKSMDDAFRRQEEMGYPMGDDAFVTDLERKFGKSLRPGRAGRPKLTNAA
jgi:putative transposase